MMKQLALNLNIVGVFAVCLLSNSCMAQSKNNADSSYTLQHTISIKAKFFTTDKLSQIYVVTERNEVIKFNDKGEELFRFNNNTLGNLKHIDVTDPFNILLYYPDFMTVLTLNRTLSKTGEVDLMDLNFLEVKAIGMSNDNNIWLYDEVAFKLKKIDRSGAVLLESDDLNMILSYTPAPNFILERDNKVYCNNPQTGVLVFDNYGKYIKTLDFKTLDNFQVFNDQLIFRKNAKLMAFHLRPLVLQPITLPADVSATDEIRIQSNKFFVKKKDRVLIYEF